MIEDFSHILHGFSNLYMVSEPVLIFFFSFDPLHGYIVVLIISTSAQHDGAYAHHQTDLL